MSNLFNSLLGLVSTVIYYPVVSCLFLLLGWTLYCLGGFLREAVQRQQATFSWRHRTLAALDAKLASSQDETLPYLDLALEDVLQTAEKHSVRTLDKTRYAIRSGPTLGLMGTLIPMASGLTGLSQGNLSGLTSHMATAFATTVLGLAIGFLAYTISLVREKWLQADLQVITLRAETLLRTATADVAAVVPR